MHTWDVAQATGQVAVLDPGLVHDALGPARQFAPLARLSGLVGPECAVPEDAGDLTHSAAWNVRDLQAQLIRPASSHSGGGAASYEWGP